MSTAQATYLISKSFIDTMKREGRRLPQNYISTDDTRFYGIAKLNHGKTKAGDPIFFLAESPIGSFYLDIERDFDIESIKLPAFHQVIKDILVAPYKGKIPDAEEQPETDSPSKHPMWFGNVANNVTRLEKAPFAPQPITSSRRIAIAAKR